MKVRPILFSTPMVKAILEGRKTQTRRAIKNIKYCQFLKMEQRSPNIFGAIFRDENHSFPIKFPYGKPGDVLWVKETVFPAFRYMSAPLFQDANRYLYKADDALIGCHKWTPSIHMPKDAARIWLMIEHISVEPLQNILSSEAIKEGVVTGEGLIAGSRFYYDYESDLYNLTNARSSFKTLWRSINGPGSWEANPWVWVIEFVRIEKPIGEVTA